MKCMETNFGGRSHSGFGDLAPFCLPSKMAKISFLTMDYIHGGQKIESAQKIHASRGSHEMHGNQFWWTWPLQFRRFRPFFTDINSTCSSYL